MKYRIGIGLGAAELDATSFSSSIRAVVDAGFDSVWLSDTLTMPGPDVTVALGWAAQVQPTMRIGVTMLLPGRNPVRLAKSLATVDVLSEGRLLVTFVPGAARGSESEAIGIPVGERGRVIEQSLPKLRGWWAGDEVDGIRVTPLPLQQPLECWLTGLAPGALDRCGRLGDGWLTSECTPAEAAVGRRRVMLAADVVDRVIDPEHFDVSLAYSRRALDDRYAAAIAARTRGRNVDPAAMVAVGLPALRDRLTAFMDAGMSKFVIRPIPAELTWSETLEELAATVLDLQT